jgi:hypothetical protein
VAVNPIQLQKYLRGIEYPARKEDLIRHAEQHGADGHVLATLRAIPEREYNGPNAVSEAVGAET